VALLFLTMRLQNGTQTCENCGGQGCYWCRQQGTRSQCPVCMNSEPELLINQGETVQCQSCGSTFDTSGRTVQRDLDYPGPEDFLNPERKKA
jgi:hypothetical protein